MKKLLEYIVMSVAIVFTAAFASGFMMLYSINDLILDCKNNKVFYHKDNTYLYTQYTWLTLAIMFCLGLNGVCIYFLFDFILSY